MSARSTDGEWWRGGVIYEIYVRSFKDSNGDGVGDLPGVTQCLDYLEWLGVDGIWLTPIMPSPNADWGYDVADYVAVNPEFGTLADLDELVAAASRRGIRVLLDLVPNHTSDRHPWFVDARSARDAAHRDWYVWADPAPGRALPNNWLDSTGNPAWTRDERTGQYYLHRFLPAQPDLNWWLPDVREAFDRIMRFWFDRGVAGFRIDVANGIVKDRLLRDDPPAGAGDDAHELRGALLPVFSSNRPEVHDVLRQWRAIAGSYRPQRVLVGETWVYDLDALARYYGSGGDELQLAFNFPFMFSELTAMDIARVVDATLAHLPADACPVWAGSNHDVSRMATRWARGDERAARAALLMLLTLPGTAALYFGDELGLPDSELPAAAIRDGFALAPGHLATSRDPQRTPMPWSPGPGAGFTAPGVRPWLPVDAGAPRTVAGERADPGSILRLCRDAVALRRARDDLRTRAWTVESAGEQVLVAARGAFTVVVLNLSAQPATAAGPGEVLISTDRDRDGERLTGAFELRPWEAMVVARA